MEGSIEYGPSWRLWHPGEGQVPAFVLNPRQPIPIGWLEEAFQRLLWSAEGHSGREGVKNTPVRAAKAWRERMDGYTQDPAKLFTTFDADGYDEMIVVRDIPFYSTCEHHCEDIIGEAHVAYIAQGKIVGLSKLARLVDIYAKRLQTQERMTTEIADAIEKHLQPKGVAVVLSARHMCMERRGVKKPGATTITSAMRGAMRDNPESRAEALGLLR